MIVPNKEDERRRAIMVLTRQKTLMYCEYDSFEGVYVERAVFYDRELGENYLSVVAYMGNMTPAVVVRTAKGRLYGCSKFGPAMYKVALEAQTVDRLKDIVAVL